MSLLSPQLEAFIAVAELKTVHGAADVLHITQTGITQRIRNLEAKLSTSLFVRTRRGMTLTPEGEALLRYCYAVQEIEGEALANIQMTAINAAIRITICGPTSIMTARVIPQCVSIMEKFPKLLMEFDINDVDDRVQALRSGKCQFAILKQEDLAPEMEYKILKPENYVLVCTPEWKKRSLQDIIKQERIIDYDPSDQLTFDYLRHFNLIEYANHERHFANRTDALGLLLVNGQGYGVLSTEFSKPYIVNKQLIVLNAGKVFAQQVVLAWFARHQPPAYFTAISEAIV